MSRKQGEQGKMALGERRSRKTPLRSEREIKRRWCLAFFLGFQSGSRPSLNSVFLWSLPPYSVNFNKIRPIVYEKSCKQTNRQRNKHTKVIAISRFSRDIKVLATQRFEISTLAFLAKCPNRLSYRVVLIWLLL